MTVYVPAQLTPLSQELLREALIAGHWVHFGVEPSARRLAVAWAQCAYETAYGGSMWNYNFGNIKCFGFPICNDLSPWLKEGSDEHPYQRVYPDPSAGAAEYWKLLASSRYAAHNVLGAFDDGNPEEAAARLRAGGWFGAPLHQAQAAMRSAFDVYADKWCPACKAASAQPAGERYGGIIVGVSLAAVGGLLLWMMTREEWHTERHA